jgi:hypothetical protein
MAEPGPKGDHLLRSTNPLQRLIGKLKPHDPKKNVKPDMGATRVAVCALFLEIVLQNSFGQVGIFGLDL